ncbi:uncharacterized protein LOC111600015 [Drosophila hydei]|uniref:Uncharacterized protein LOC111600015 n=1 Tax=Drosophila hydei TaxID=7224 RepID=A0A6J1LYL4_DROHY|nr:uncharacterized protein LOC111600015 [Drosophila hydei]
MQQATKYQRDFNTQSDLWDLAANNNNDHRANRPALVRKDSAYNKNSWKSKTKRNFDEIDKASVSFGILNPLV